MSGRGQAQSDSACFAPELVPKLQRAAQDLAWLLGRGYAPVAATKLVGDHHQLLRRQREALRRGVAAPDAAAGRRARRRESVRGEALCVDGFNVLITVESGLAGGYLIEGLDGAWRDLASVHGSYRRVAQTQAALVLLGETLEAAAPAQVTWYFDRPVSNSGRVAAWVRALGASSRAPWEVYCVDDPDRRLAAAKQTVATSDAWILDAAPSHFPLAELALGRSGRPLNRVRLGERAR